MRGEIREEKVVTRSVVTGYTVKCDLCSFDADETMIFEVRAEVGADDCVGTRITRDTCQECYEDKLAPIFDKLFEALDASNEDMLELREEDRWYG